MRHVTRWQEAGQVEFPADHRGQSVDLATRIRKTVESRADNVALAWRRRQLTLRCCVQAGSASQRPASFT